MEAARDAIETSGAELHYLQPYSLDPNPIELGCSKFKALLKKAAARSIPDLQSGIAAALPQFTPDDCRGYFAETGYGSI